MRPGPIQWVPCFHGLEEASEVGPGPIQWVLCLHGLEEASEVGPGPIQWVPCSHGLEEASEVGPGPIQGVLCFGGFSEQQLLETAKKISDAKGDQSIEHCNEGSRDAILRTEDQIESLYPWSPCPSSPALSVTWNLLVSAPSSSPWVVATAARNACTTSWNSFGVRCC